jgi:Fe-S-cluster containining protein
MWKEGFRCQHCGRCCRLLGIEYELLVTEADVARWRAEGRADILAWVGRAVFSDEYQFPVDPRTGDEVEGVCPFLRKLPGRNQYVCRIYDTRPEDCRRFPASREDAEQVSCRGYL